MANFRQTDRVPFGPRGRRPAVWIGLLMAAAGIALPAPPLCEASPTDLEARQAVTQFVRGHCLDCHNGVEKSGGLSLEALQLDDLRRSSATWERVLRKLAARQMPPADAQRPTEAAYETTVAALSRLLDAHADAHPQPGRTDTFRRLTRTEYRYAIRDLLALDVDVSELLPNDELSHGFDNVIVGDLSPTLLDRYLTAAEQISRLALGRTSSTPRGDTFRLRPDITQEEHVEGLPLGTRGGALIPHVFPQTGDYEIQIRLARDRNEHLEGLHEPHELEILIDGERQAQFTVRPPSDPNDNAAVDAALRTRVRVAAGPHELGVTFVKKPSLLLETRRQPYAAHFNMHRHPRLSPAIYQVSITGPWDVDGADSRDTPSRRKILICRPETAHEEDACARQILASLARRAYRRELQDAELETLMRFYREGCSEGGEARFEAGIERALAAILVNPRFLFRIELDPPGLPPGTAYRLSDRELATRLSFFLWSSLPDEELLDLAEQGELTARPEILEQQVARLLADPRSQSLVSNFASQWLYLRNLDSLTPDLRLFPDFDDNLRQSFRRETELLFETILREDRSVLDLLQPDFTHVNERLAKHYGIPHIFGSRFRRIELNEQSQRGGILRQGSILTVTSYATRTSPVLRGNWVLKNLVGTPPPPPPADVPPLPENTIDSTLSIRQRLEEHRNNAACASCHNLMDPVGFALENYDAVGRWRDVEFGQPLDVAGGLPDGSEFAGVRGLEQALLERPELFVGTLVEKLMTYAIGRGVEPSDGPAIRRIVADARRENYRFSSLITGIVHSVPFQMRSSE